MAAKTLTEAQKREAATLRRLRKITTGPAEDSLGYMPNLGHKGRPTKAIAAELERLSGLGYVKRPVNAAQNERSFANKQRKAQAAARAAAKAEKAAARKQARAAKAAA
jgi:hypothetical protein